MKNRVYCAAISAACAAVALSPLSVRAQVSGTWLVGNGSWSVGSNWTSDPQFPNLGGVATFVDRDWSDTAPQIEVDTPITLGSIVTDSYHVFTIYNSNPGNAITLVGAAEVQVKQFAPHTLSSFHSGQGTVLYADLAGTAGLTKTGAGPLTLLGSNTYSGGTRVLGGKLIVDEDSRLGNAAGSITLDGGTLSLWTPNSSPTTFTTARTILLGAGGGTLETGEAATLNGAIEGSGDLTILRSLRGATFTAANTFSGKTTLLGNATLAAGGAIGSSIRVDVANPWTLTLDNAGQANSDRIGNVPVALHNAALTLIGNGSSAVNEHIGTLSIDGAFSRVNLQPSAAQSLSLTAAALERVNDGVATFSGGASLGATPGAGVANIYFDTAPTLVGGGGPANSTSISIMPFSVALDGTGARGLATYGADGVRPLAAAEYASSLPAGNSTLNVSLTGAIASSSASQVNALRLQADSNDVVVSGGGTITVSSGLIVSSSRALGTNRIEAPIAFGSTTGLLVGSAFFDAPISGSAGATFAGAFTLNADSAYTGATLLSMASVRFRGDLLPGTPGPLGADSSAITLQNGSLLFDGAGTGTVGRGIVVRGASTVGMSLNGMSSQHLFINGPVSGNGSLLFTGAPVPIEVNGTLTGEMVLSAGSLTTVVLNGNNSFSGNVLLNGGTFVVGSNTALGTATINGGFGTLAAAGAPRTLANPVQLFDRMYFGAGPALVLSGPVSGGYGNLIQVPAGGDVTFAGAFTGDSVDLIGGGILRLAGPIARVHGLNVNAGTLVLFGNGATRAQVLSVAGGPTAPTASVDLGDSDLILTATSIDDTRSLIRFARHNGAWDRPGITSSAARVQPSHATTLGLLGGAEYKAVNAPTFDGYAVANSDTLVKYTWYGDTDFNGVVNFDDYVRTDNGFNNHLTGWLNGDFDLNNTVNFDDYVLIDLAFNTQSGTLRRALSLLDSSAPDSGNLTDPALRRVEQHFRQFGDAYASHFLASVPEPAVAGAASLLAAVNLIRRRRRR